MSVATVWQAVARLGGHRGRRRDGPPGRSTRWTGRLQLHTLLEGARFIARLRW